MRRRETYPWSSHIVSICVCKKEEGDEKDLVIKKRFVTMTKLNKKKIKKKNRKQEMVKENKSLCIKP
jgi:hypothetical protein